MKDITSAIFDLFYVISCFMFSKLVIISFAKLFKYGTVHISFNCACILSLHYGYFSSPSSIDFPNGVIYAVFSGSDKYISE